ncbi:MAG: beta-propeller domain-containing protein [Deltaproteobacteria bacterium]|nr:beta-propeller domain-containing protein [Deltaproteobacteria bacterium]
MKRLTWMLALAAPIALACGSTEEPEEIHEKADAADAALAAGWKISVARSETTHPLGDSVKEDHLVEAPDTALKMRLVFAEIRMERDYDFVIIQDEWGNEVERITGNHRAYVSRTIPGRRAKIVVTTDESVRSWGYRLDQLRHRGCEHNDPAPAAPARMTSCQNLLTQLQERAVAEVRRRFSEGRYGPVLYRSTAPSLAGPETTAPQHSETNTRVDGVDEADVVKTDGNRIFAIAGQELRVFKSWPAAESALLHRLSIEGWPRELFLANGKVVVISGVQGDRVVGPGPGRPGPMLRFMPIWWRPDALTKLTEIDVSGPTPVVSREVLLAGRYSTARRVGSSIRLVVERELSWPELRYWPENVEGNTPEWERAMDELEAEAVRAVTRRALADWLPDSYVVQNGRRVPLAFDCADFWVPEGDGRLGLSSVATYSLDTREVSETSVLASSNVIYQSTANLYLTSTHRWSCGEDEGLKGNYSYVHQLDVSRPDRVDVVASGGFAGAVEDSFELDEHEGYLRVATTETHWAETDPARQITNRVIVLGRRGGELLEVGRTRELAPGERVFGTRFMGDRGFVVTFRQVDPLFTLDLSDPTQPTVVGELEVPGFSTYLHPLDDSHLFAIGNDFELDGRTRNGTALSVFDVSDLARPTLVQKVVVGSRNGSSEALFEHRAFTFYRPRSGDPLIAIPFTDWVEGATSWDSFVSQLKIFRARPDGVTELGAIDHRPLYAQTGDSGFGWHYQPNVRRGVFVEDQAYAISDAGLVAAPISDLTRIAAEVFVPVAPPAPEIDPISTISKDAAPLLVIPDNDPRGVRSIIQLTDELDVTGADVEVEIKHSYRGDLVLRLEHAGVTEILHDRTGGSSDDLIRTFSTSRFQGLSSAGPWTLVAVDAAGADVGKLMRWALTVSGRKPSAPAEPNPLVERTFENTDRTRIPDAKVEGASSSIEVPYGMKIEDLEVAVEIRHPFRGDLVVTLEHEGKSWALSNRAGGSADDLVGSFRPEGLVGTDARGRWTLRAVDAAADDVGEIVRFSLEVRGELR